MTEEVKDFTAPVFTTENDEVAKALDETAARVNTDEKYANSVNETLVEVRDKSSQLTQIEVILKSYCSDSQSLKKALAKINEVL